jgi:uncharacterized damage-inducible protein DinB
MAGMTEPADKEALRVYLQAARNALLWKMDGLGEYDVRRPLVPTGTNLLGLVKHAAGVEAGYLGWVFGRPLPEAPVWMSEDTGDNADFSATPQESREYLVELYRAVWAHADTTIDELALDTTGQVPWWPPERRTVTLHRILVHVIADLQRHAGHADLVRELIDGSVGLRAGNSNLPSDDPDWWRAHHDRVEQAARTAAGR